MTLVVQQTAINTVAVEEQQVLVVEQDQVRVVTIGIQGPAGPQGPRGPAGLSGAITAPDGAEGGILFKQDGGAAIDSDNLRYNLAAQQLEVSRINNAVMDGGNF